MATLQSKKAMILTHRIVPGHQITEMLKMHGWSAASVHNHLDFRTVREARPGMLVLDLTNPDGNHLALLAEYRKAHSLCYIVALCRGGNSPAMRAARDLGVDGFFYLNHSGLSIDPSIGLAPLLMNSQTSDLQQTHLPDYFSNFPGFPESIYGNI